jgi:hypothetical protein
MPPHAPSRVCSRDKRGQLPEPPTIRRSPGPAPPAHARGRMVLEH